MRIAILDLGTNTFQLMIAEKIEQTDHEQVRPKQARPKQARTKIIFLEKRFVKIGQGGINDGFIATDAYQRALDAMVAYSKIIDEYQVQKVAATATSAIRSAQNGQQLLDDIAKHANIHPQTISGDREAELIFEGIKWDIELTEEKVLVMDIGGGSVEFVIGNQDQLFWKRSFEIGAQRLYDLFHHQEPIAPSSIQALENYLTEQLAELQVAISQHQPQQLVGSSGTFDTVWEVFATPRSPRTMTYEEFLPIHESFITKNLTERLAMKGMLEMRSEMIVVASCLLDFVFQQLPTNRLSISQGALREGVLMNVLSK